MRELRAGALVGAGRLVLLSAPLLALLFATAAPASAHRDVRTVVHHDGRGSVWVDVMWSDGHPVTSPVVATITGQADDGSRIGPAPLRAIDPRSPSVVRYEGTLSAGDWTTTVDVAAPGIGYCQARLTVRPSAAPERDGPSSVTCGGTPQEAAPPQRAARPAADNGYLALVAAAGAALLAGLLCHRRRRDTSSRARQRRR